MNSTYIVIKKEDTLKYLAEPALQSLEYILNRIAEGRSADGKEPVNEYYICNTIEPYAEKVHGVIATGEYNKKKGMQNMKSYNPDNNSGVHTVEVTLQQCEYIGHITSKISGNCKGKDILDFDFECADTECLESDCDLKCDEESDYFSVTLKDSEGNTLDVDGDADEFNNMIVKTEIIDFVREQDCRER